MKLKKLELCGFKTFPEPTQIVFHDGITAVVGPNGCGKSNIIDAIRWVMGETSAKGLRGDTMADVIFAGSDSRKPLGMAEVTLTLTEVEGALPDKFGRYHEVAITRRLHRSGESEYLINKIPCRLRDIMELFMDTGVGRRAYSVVEQGRIDAILAAKPEERRFLIEEAAGITKFRSRKEETQRKMGHVRQNLERIGDVIGEVRREMNALKRQAARAEAFRRVRAERREVERHLLVHRWRELREQEAAAGARVTELEGRLVEAHAGVSRVEAEVEQAKLGLLDREKGLEGVQKAVYEGRSRIAQAEERVAFLRRGIDELAERARAAEAEAADLEGRQEELTGEAEAARAELAELEASLERRDGTLETLEAEHETVLEAQREAERALEGRRREALDVLSEVTRLGHGLDHAARQEADAQRRLSESNRTEAEARERLGEVEAEIELRRAELARAEAERDEARQDRERTEEALRVLRGRRDGAGRKAEELRRRLHADESRLQSLEQLKNRFEWYAEGVREVLTQAAASGRNGVRGVVADILTAPPEYEAALEAALGERLQYVIVEDPDRGLEAVAHLKARRVGRSSFAPVELRPAAAPVFPASGAPGSLGPLLDLVEVAEGYEAFARGLLGDVFVVETLEHAVALWRQNGMRATLVTLEGDTVTPEGVISGGVKAGEQAGLLRKNREIRELRRSVQELGAALEAAEAEVAELDREAERLAAELEAAREEAHRRDLQVVHLGRDLERLADRRDRLVERCEGLAFEREELAEAVETFRSERQRLEAERLDAAERHRRLEEQVEALEAEVEELRERARTLGARVTQQRVQEAADRQRRAGLVERIRTLDASLDNVARRRERLAQEAERCRRERGERAEELRQVLAFLDVARRELETAEASAREVADALDAARTRVAEGEKALAEARRRLAEAQDAHNRASLELREREVEVRGLADRFREKTGDDIEQADRQGLPEGFDPAVAQDRLAELDRKIATFGEVNLLAIEQYEERKERFEFLERQRQDLEGSLASLQEAIRKIDRESRKRFGETFERVSRAFRDLYPKLFRGGEAELVLTDPDDLLATGIDIVARPPGKRPQHISLLSGGEKALTAVALIFAIFEVKPSPFCILDEVDAPLDEANIGRFTQLLTELKGRSQFVIITHNRSTMEAADHLYGVTMPEAGVSRVLSVRLTPDAPAEAA
ncbi:chromosome segregation protein SMC [Deferrisoma camini]|uniref:chromosome segregation protein SMC n=1 Tax=Deferrisoma camini TaxID=1035120 RepID=UPI00046CB34B|nr:chromosome segregation protein SMC [Deferrisoma camini]